MADQHYTITAAVTPETLLSWSDHRNVDALRQGAAAFLKTYSTRDWLMSDISAHRAHLSLSSLNWLATEGEAERDCEEHLDSSGRWWFVSILYRSDLLPSISDIDAILNLAQEAPHRFGADDEIVQAAREWDSGCAEVDFDVPNGGDGDDPMYVVCAVFGLRRLLNFAYTHGLCILHLRFSFRPGV